MSNKWPRSGVLGRIRNPLIFYALALFLIEGIIGSVVATSCMTDQYKFLSICIMAFLFFVVVVAVTVITIKWPRHLYKLGP